MRTLVANADDFNIRNVPLWAIPGIAHLRKNVEGLSVMGFSAHECSDFGTIHVHIQGRGILSGFLDKKDMNNPQVIPLW